MLRHSRAHTYAQRRRVIRRRFAFARWVRARDFDHIEDPLTPGVYRARLTQPGRLARHQAFRTRCCEHHTCTWCYPDPIPALRRLRNEDRYGGVGNRGSAG